MTDVIKTAAELRRVRDELDGTVGLVATMGALHAGHAALLERARAECDRVIATLFVNRTQFNDASDYESYPRDFDGDLAALTATGADFVFAPSEAEMFPSGAFQVKTAAFDAGAEARARGAHFDGVTTVVAKLLILTRPQRAYFGEKDAHQLRIVRALNADLLFGAEIVAVPTARAADGLAHSSRNARLSAPERAGAAVLYSALTAAEAVWRRGVRNAAALRRVMSDAIKEEPLARLEYVSVADPSTLLELNKADGVALLSAAARFGDVRLIDNLLLESR